MSEPTQPEVPEPVEAPEPEPEPEPEPDENPDAEPVEPVEPIDGDDEPHEPGEQPDSPQGLSEKEIEKIFKKLEGEQVRHRGSLERIMGDAFETLIPCELCNPSYGGFRSPFELDEETAARVRVAIGDDQAAPYKADQYSKECETCNGYGEVLSGSKVQGQDVLVCRACDGKGWTPIGNERRTGYVPPPAVPDANGEIPMDAALPDVDTPEVAALKAQGYVIIKPSVPVT